MNEEKRQLLQWLKSKQSDKFLYPALRKMGKLGDNAYAIKNGKSIWRVFELLFTIYMVIFRFLDVLKKLSLLKKLNKSTSNQVSFGRNGLVENGGVFTKDITNLSNKFLQMTKIKFHTLNFYTISAQRINLGRQFQKMKKSLKKCY